MKSTADKNRSRDPINIVTVTQSLHSTLENFTYRQTGGVFTQLILAIHYNYNYNYHRSGIVMRKCSYTSTYIYSYIPIYLNFDFVVNVGTDHT